jgi:hypothetical protein
MQTLTHEQLIILSWIIGMANPASAWLVGPFLAWLLRRRSPAARRRVSLAGWLVLGVAQVAFLAFGFGSGFLGFRYAQPLMIPISLLNFVAVYWLAKRASDQGRREPLSELAVRRAAQRAYGRWMDQASVRAVPWRVFVKAHPLEAQQWVEAARAALASVYDVPPTSDAAVPGKRVDAPS